MLAVYKRELRSFFYSMTGYIFIAAVLLFTGIYFLANNLSFGVPYFTYTLMSSMLIYVIVTPILTMRSLSDERRSKTDQLLLTSPTTVPAIVLGKYFAMLTVFAIPLVIFCVYPFIIATGGNSYILGDYIGIFGTLMVGALFVSIGMFVSSLTENQIVAAVITMGLLLILYMWDSLLGLLPVTALGNLACSAVILAAAVLCIWLFSRNKIITIVIGVLGVAALAACYAINPEMFAGIIPTLLSSFSIVEFMNNLCSYYVFDLGGLFMCLSVAGVFVFLTIQTIQKRRWS